MVDWGSHRDRYLDSWTGVSHRDWYLDYGGPGVS